MMQMCASANVIQSAVIPARMQIGERVGRQLVFHQAAPDRSWQAKQTAAERCMTGQRRPALCEIQCWRSILEEKERCSEKSVEMSNNQPVFLTPEGLKKVKDELEYLTTVRRREVAQMIAEAKAEGDISENAGYDEAKTAQGFLEGRIRELETILKNAKVISETSAAPDVVMIGRTAVVREEGSDLEEEYTIVGPPEADPSKGRISNESPMGRALLNKRVGEQAVVVSPGGEIVFEIVKVK